MSAEAMGDLLVGIDDDCFFCSEAKENCTLAVVLEAVAEDVERSLIAVTSNPRSISCVAVNDRRR